MRSTMKFSQKMIVMPALVILALSVLFFVSQYFSQKNTDSLTQIETGFVPALEWAHILERQLTALERAMQDAVSAQDQDELQKAHELANAFSAQLEAGRSLPIVTPEEYQAWRAAFDRYYARATEISKRLIAGESVSDKMVAEMQALTSEYNKVREQAHEEIEEAKHSVSEAFDKVSRNDQAARRIMTITALAFGGGCALFAVLLSLSVTRPLKRVSDVANQLALGNTDVTISVTSQDEIGNLAEVFAGLIDTNKELAKAATAIGNGDYSVPVRIRSAHDVLGNALAVMKTNLMANTQEIEAQSWLKTGLTELNERLRGEKSVAELARHVVTFVARYLDAQIGAICLMDEESGVLNLAGSYAYSSRKGVRNAFRLGEGLIGQAALEKQAILFSDVPDDYICISSELGERTPHYILVVPFLHSDHVVGVLELGAAQKFTTRQREFLDQASESIAIAFHSAAARLKMKALLEETQQQSATLREQQEELRRANEELEEQASTLRASEEKLRQQQEELRQTNEELSEQTNALERQQRQLQEKNAELEQARLLIEQKARDLELSSKYKSEFLSNMSHELRTPLNSMLILSRLLYENKEGNLADKQIEYARTIHASGSELLNLINEILDLSKIEAGKMAVNIEEIHLRGVCAYVQQHFAHIAEERGLFLNVECADDAPEVMYSDRQRVEQILKNLLSNAMKFTHQGGITVRIARPAPTADLLKSGLNARATVAFAVTDTGIGIPQDKQRIIFEAFQQADGTTSRKYGGTGLGLSITRELAKLLGGELHVQSAEGVGSTFTLFLPDTLSVAAPQAAHSAPKSPPQKAAPPHPPAAPPVNGNNIRDDRQDMQPDEKSLLIVEDDPHFAKILFDMARERGFKGLIAEDGAAGLQLADQYRPDAIILDIQLPGMDGWAVMEKLKTNPATRHIPIHCISAHHASLDAMKMGAVGYVTKPVTLENLEEVFLKIEELITQQEKKLLIVEDNEAMRDSLCELLRGNNVQMTMAASAQDAYAYLRQQSFDCVVLDLGLADASGFSLLEGIKADARFVSLPIIVYTGKDLTKEEEHRLQKDAESIIIKGVKSPERLLDEVTLFLHCVEAELPEHLKKKIRMLHDKEQVFDEKTVLIVDDDMRNVFALSSVMEGKGMDILVAENGKEALEQLDARPDIDLVLMDIMMPEMNGYETMQQIRAQPRFGKLPIIALTAKAMKGDRQKCIEAGANDYLSKPIDIDKLLSLLRVWLY